MADRPEERVSKIVSAVVHELVHAFADIYQCNGRDCQTFMETDSGFGFTGHRPCWLNMIQGARWFMYRFVDTFVPQGEEGDDFNCMVSAGLEKKHTDKFWNHYEGGRSSGEV